MSISKKGAYDRIMFEAIKGNRSLIDRISKDIKNNSLSHAYIIEGPRGSGRHTIALSTIAALCCKSKNISGNNVPCGQCSACKKILSGQSLDVKHITRDEDRATIGIEAVRNIRDDVYISPIESDVKAYIINEAELLTLQGQNAFLLTLEEPPSYIVFFLICENSSLLLETIRSRAPTLRTERLCREDVEEFILKNDTRAASLKDESPEEFDTLLSVSDGRIGYALELLNPKIRGQIFECRETAKKIVLLLSDRDRTQAIATVTSLSKNRQEVTRQIVFLQYALRDLILLKKSDDAPLCFYEDRDDALELATHFTSKALLALYDASADAVSELERNSNVRLTMLNMMRKAELI